MRFFALSFLLSVFLATGATAQNQPPANAQQMSDLTQAIGNLTVLLNNINRGAAPAGLTSPGGTSMTCTKFCKDCQSCESYCCEATDPDDLDLVIITDDE
ncbi:hypothetical protein [Pseudoruegeria sp. HB172150]|uniref:hypothetical protein n=1 Tax=Pseudoruegeria sp. HB172150 TaxID=2721164 RepID=UPI001551D09E|nr:hypothetical protein [Pseudoruegeria sp. HB172150]